MIGLDIDNVLSQTSQSILDEFNALWGTTFTQDQWTDWDVKTCLGLTDEQDGYFTASFADPDWYQDLPVVDGADQGATHFTPDHDIVYITSRPESARAVTTAWLDNRGFPFGQVIFTHDKQAICRELDVTVMVEDNLDHAIKIQECCSVLLLDYPWNRKPYLPPSIRRFQNWHDIVRWAS